MKPLSKKKNPIKVKKQQLIEKINSCKTLKELEQFERTMSYYDVLKENYEWDDSFLFELIKFKLIRMRDYFWTHNIVENEKQYGDQINVAINLLNVGYLSDDTTNEQLTKNSVYVNDKNIKRYLLSDVLFYSEHKNLWDKYGLCALRITKAKRLFWKYLEHHVESWWD